MEDHLGLLLAVVTQDSYHFVLHFFWHRRCIYLLIELSVLGPHVAETLAAEWTLVLVLA